MGGGTDISTNNRFGFSYAVNDTCHICVFGNDINELVLAAIDINESEFLINFVKVFIPHLNTRHLKDIEVKLIELNRIWNILDFVRIVLGKYEGYNLQAIEKHVLESKNPWAIRRYAEAFNISDITKFEDALINLEYPGEIYLFTCNYMSKGVNIEKMYDAVVKYDDSLLYVALFKKFILNQKLTFKERLSLFMYE